MKKRTVYEGKLIRIIENSSHLYGQRGTNSHGIDILLFKNSNDGFFSPALRGEVKTSTNTKLWLRSDRERKQYENYMRIYQNHNATTIYFYRLISRLKCIEIKRKGREKVQISLKNEKDKWRAFFVENIPLSNSGFPILDFSEGIPLSEFIDILNSE